MNIGLAESSETSTYRWYDIHAPSVVPAYEAIAARDVHPELFAWLDGRSGLRVLDIGCGSGRDAAAIAKLGNYVVAADPSQAMLESAQSLHPDAAVEWKLAGLPSLHGINGAFDLVLLSAVWMHIPPEEHGASLRRLAGLIAPEGQAFLSLRLGEDDHRRCMHAVDPCGFAASVSSAGLQIDEINERSDALGRTGVRWRAIRISRPR